MVTETSLYTAETECTPQPLLYAGEQVGLQTHLQQHVDLLTAVSTPPGTAPGALCLSIPTLHRGRENAVRATREKSKLRESSFQRQHRCGTKPATASILVSTDQSSGEAESPSTLGIQGNVKLKVLLRSVKQRLPPRINSS